MSIVQKYQFSGGAAMPLHEIAAALTVGFQIGGNNHGNTNGNTNALNHLGIPAGLVMSNVKELYNNFSEEHVATLPEDMFDRMLVLVSPQGHVHKGHANRPAEGHVNRPTRVESKKIRLTPRKKHSNIKTRRL